MRSAALVVALLLGLAAGASAQTTTPDPLANLDIYRCAVGGAHQVGCSRSADGCTFEQWFAGTCQQLVVGTPVEVPPPPAVTEAPTARVISAPIGLADTGAGVAFIHDGINVQWFTLRVDGEYDAHVNSGLRFVAYAEALAPGTHAVTISACGDPGCTVSATLQVTR